MASRRLAISSLLCDNEQPAVGKSQSSPTSDNSSRVPLSPTVYSPQTASYASLQPSASDSRSNIHYEEQRYGPSPGGFSTHSPEYQRNPVPPFPSMSRYHSSSAPRTAYPAPIQITRQSSPVLPRSPSPPFYASQFPSVSPIRSSARRERRDVDQAFPRLDDQDSDYATRQVQRHPPSFHSHHSPLSQIHVVDDSHQRRRLSVNLNTRNFSPVQQTYPLSSPLPNNFPSTATHSLSLPFSDSPVISTPASSQAFTYNTDPSEGSPTLLRLPEASMTTQRSSLSPSVARGAPSGLDFLLEAVEMEKTNSDSQKSPKTSSGTDSAHSQTRLESLSPDISRLDTKIQHGPPPTPPYTGGYISPEDNDVQQQTRLDPESGRAMKRRRPSPESIPISHSHHVSQSESSSSLSGQHSQISERRLMDDSPHGHKPRSPYAAAFQVPTNSSNHTIISHREIPHSSSHTHMSRRRSKSPEILPPTPVESERDITAYAKQSPPRSKPRPRKPGSAALAAVEKELHAVKLSDNVNGGEGTRVNVKDSFPMTHVKDKHTSRPKPPSSSNLKLQPRRELELGIGTDEDVDDFFQSTFDSPRPKNAESHKVQQAHDLKAEVVTHEGPRNHKTHERRHVHDTHSILEVLNPNKASRNYSSDEMDRAFDSLSPNALEEAGKTSDGETEFLDELVDAFGASTSEDERTDIDDQGADAMEVDVDNELLDLIDGPIEQETGISRGSHLSAQKPSTEFEDLTSAPHLADTSEALIKQTKDNTKDTNKSKAKSKAGHAGVQLEDFSVKPTKSKSGGRSKAAKGESAEKSKSGKAKKEPFASGSQPSTPVSIINQPVTALEDIQVTSSGRMVTKSKKSVAAAAAAAYISSSRHSSSHSRKKAVTSGEVVNPRSRSHSVMPRASVDPEPQREKSAKVEDDKNVLKEKEKEPEEDEAEEDNILYCICKTTYDEDRIMIACDRCDEWYHTQCVDMPDLEVDLVDQFICPNCVQQNPSLHLRTTYKQRCFSGLHHANPDSVDACHKPSRGLLSKYCSDECGARYMHRKIQTWAKQGGNVESLWESVKNRERRDGLVVREPGRTLPRAILAEIQKNSSLSPQFQDNDSEPKPDAASDIIASNQERVLARLHIRLKSIEQEREDLKREMELISLRERLLQLALEREEQVDDCGWDQRLVWDHDEWYVYGTEVLENYWVPPGSVQNDRDEELDMDVDQQEGEFECWCKGEKKCPRHNGWQKLRTEEIEDDKRRMEDEQARLTALEQEIQNRIEMILRPHLHARDTAPELTLTFKTTYGKNPEENVKKSKRKTITAA